MAEGAGTSMRSLSAEMGVKRFYPADRLAGDVLRGVDHDRALIVAPASARFTWRLFRLAPELMLRLSSAMSRRQGRKTDAG